jgi:hypothetical protein
MTRELPILCTDSVALAIRSGAQTQHRVPVTKHTSSTDGTPWEWLDWASPDVRAEDDCLFSPCCLKVPIGAHGGFHAGETTHRVTPHWGIGDRLYVREAHAPRYFDDDGTAYRADWHSGLAGVIDPPKWTPSIHMPKAIARTYTGPLLRVWIERVQDISAADCIAEGTEYPYPSGDPFVAFQHLWDRLYPGSWDRNDWVWCCEWSADDREVK